VGTFRVSVEIALPGRHPRWTAVERVLVDTGAEVTWLPEELLRRLGVAVFKRDDLFLTADGRAVTRDVGIVLLRHGDFRTVDEVVFAKPGDLRLLGARTLEGFNARVDPRRKRLVAAGPLTAASVARVRLVGT
jgi:predicted aspartyl protease